MSKKILLCMVEWDRDKQMFEVGMPDGLKPKTYNEIAGHVLATCIRRGGTKKGALKESHESVVAGIKETESPVIMNRG